MLSDAVLRALRAFSSEDLVASFGTAQVEHFWWQTSGPYVSERERALVRAAFWPLSGRVLDVGCGEGATLVHLGSPEGAVGVDLFEEKLAFAREHVPGCTFVRASADELPFEPGSFDHVIVRDVVHHIEDPKPLVRECRRVLRPGGRLDVLEPCRNNPLIALHALANAAERGELRSTAPFLSSLVRDDFVGVSVEHLQALPIHRVLLHPSLGEPARGESPAWRRAIEQVEHLAERLLPKLFWAYLHLRATRP